MVDFRQVNPTSVSWSLQLNYTSGVEAVELDICIHLRTTWSFWRRPPRPMLWKSNWECERIREPGTWPPTFWHNPWGLQSQPKVSATSQGLQSWTIYYLSSSTINLSTTAFSHQFLSHFRWIHVTSSCNSQLRYCQWPWRPPVLKQGLHTAHPPASPF